jgi:hypothetical protein
MSWYGCPRLYSLASFANYLTGISGNALALTDKKFEHFLTYTTGNEMKAMEKDGLLEKSSAPEGLYTGEAGRAWCWAVADLGLEKKVLGYNDL